MPEQIHDKGYKRILSKKKNFLSMLKAFINTTWVNDLTEDDLELINSEFIPKDFREKESDIIYKVKTKEFEIIFYFLLELQSTVDYTICIRLFTYIFELYKRIFLDTDINIREQMDFRLPPIIPCVLYNGSNSWTAVRSFKEYISGYELFEENLLDFKYILLNVNQYSDEILFDIGSLISTIFTLDKKQDAEILKARLMKMTKIFLNLSVDEKIDLTDWIKDVLIKKVKDENKDIVEQAMINFGKGDGSHMTYAIERLLDEIELKGELKGELKNELKFIRNKLVRGMSCREISEVFELDENYVKKIVTLINENPLLPDNDLVLKIIQEPEESTIINQQCYI